MIINNSDQGIEITPGGTIDFSAGNILNMDVGPQDDTFDNPLRILRNGSPVGWFDNSGSDLRVKSASGSSVRLINNNNNGVEVTPSDKISFGGNDVGDMPQYSDDTAPPNDTMFFDTTDSQLEYKDPSGNNHVLG
ncbi:hypothetical protein C484_10661 [Natrialba taiwanensis DSM 12281]|uniref:Uncharacterized protein n=1 Tax=Natrialba taiwanensis DSM 12281 TaxID=1230458 RepID=M0A2B6_9EURY|nr:hypothetical protein C484_10661 [Natrialba taiwanensis DSM 12281]